MLALAPAATACDRDVEERQLAEMTQQIDKLQTERDDANRVALQSEVADTRAAEGGVPPRVPAPAQPPVRSLDVGDAPGADDSPDTEDPSPRPTIRIVGSARARGDGDSTYVDDGTGGSQPQPSALDPEAKRAYADALALVNARQCDRALDALAAFLVKWPDHPYADNAMFWRGECYFAQGDYLHAAEQFEGVVTRFPAGNKAPDAMLKLGMCHLKLGDPVEAKATFDRLQQTYPQSEAARRIPPVTVRASTPSGPASEDHR